MCQSWERITLPSHRVTHGTSFSLWVTRGIELWAFIAHKMPQNMHKMRPYIGKELRHFPKIDFPVNYRIIGYESHLHFLSSHQRGTMFLLNI